VFAVIIDRENMSVVKLSENASFPIKVAEKYLFLASFRLKDLNSDGSLQSCICCQIYMCTASFPEKLMQVITV